MFNVQDTSKWVPDDAAPNCMICDVRFTFFKRRHHCRVCGRVLCGKCSSTHPTTVNNSSSKIRVCVDCHSKMRERMRRGSVSYDSNDVKIFYHTLTFCSHCFFVKRSGTDFLPATICEIDGKVMLNYVCDQHGEESVCVCDDVYFYEKNIDFTKKASSGTNVVVDIEDVHNALNRLRLSPSSDNLPFVISIQCYREGTLLSDSQIVNQIAQVNRKFPKGHNVVLKFQVGLLPKHRLDEFNNQMIRLLASPVVLKHCRTSLLEMSCERMYELSALDECVLFNSHVHPYVQYFLVRGEEERFVRELQWLLDGLVTISDIQLVLELTVDVPYPDLELALQLVRKHHKIIRVVVISRERSPNDIYARLNARRRRKDSTPDANKIADNNRGTADESVDPSALMDLIGTSSRGDIISADFVPISTTHVLEPFMSILGYGVFHLRAEAFCGFYTALINSEALQSVPLSRLVDVSVLYNEVRPIAKRLSDGEQPGIWTAKLLKKALDKAKLPHVSVPDILDYIRNDESAKNAREILDSTQFIVIHNTMDFASVDIIRRSKCMSQTLANLPDHEFVATCTRCL